MRIALVCQTFFPQVGGAEFVMHHLACQWHRQGHDVVVLNGVSEETTRAEGRYTVRRFKLLRGATRFGYHRFPFLWHGVHAVGRLVRDVRPDFISAHFGFPTGLWLARMRPTPRYLVTCHGEELTKFGWGYRVRYGADALVAEALTKSAGAIALSRHARMLMEELGVPPTNILDIPNGVEVDKFARPVDFDLRGRFGLPAEARVILSVGREHPQKAYETGVRAFAQVAAGEPDVYYVILGKNTDRWRPLAEELGVGKRVVFCPGLYGDELIGAYQQADVFFSPSIWEMLALVVLEALAAGRPQVVTNVSGSPDVIQHGENGFVVEPGRAEEMAEALRTLVRDFALRERMSRANRERAKQYSWERISRMYLEHA